MDDEQDSYLLIYEGTDWHVVGLVPIDDQLEHTFDNTTGFLTRTSAYTYSTQAQIGDADIADGAVDGGAGGEISDGTVTADDLAPN